MATHTRSTSRVAVIGIDIGKDIFHLFGFDAAGAVVLRRKIKGQPVNPKSTAAELPPRGFLELPQFRQQLLAL
jgi:hypothetical protein